MGVLVVTGQPEESIVEGIRRRRKERLGYDPDDPNDQEAARRDYKRERRRTEDHDRATTTNAYRQGVKKERERAGRRASSKRRPVGHARRRSSTARAVRQVAAPARAQVTSGLQFLGMSIAVAALYLVLTAEEQTHAFSGALGGLSKGLRWLADPSKSVPYAH